MTTSTPSQPMLWDGLSSSSPEDFPASRLVSPGSDEARRMTVTSGRKWLGLLANAGPAGCLVRTLLESLVWHSTIVSLTWKTSVTKRGRLLFRLAASARGTGENASGLLPTPSVHGSHNRAGASPSSGDGLSTAVKRMLPTPTVNDSKNNGSPSQMVRNSLVLNSAVRLLPTPHANCHTGTGKHGDGGPNLQTVIGGSLSPEFVEWLQGFPIGWTEV